MRRADRPVRRGPPASSPSTSPSARCVAADQFGQEVALGPVISASAAVAWAGALKRRNRLVNSTTSPPVLGGHRGRRGLRVDRRRCPRASAHRNPRKRRELRGHDLLHRLELALQQTLDCRCCGTAARSPPGRLPGGGGGVCTSGNVAQMNRSAPALSRGPREAAGTQF